MSDDIFEFWSVVGGDQSIHPADAEVLSRVGAGTGLRPGCLPMPFSGRLRTAPVVLLYLNPGLRPYDLEHATSPAYRRYHALARTGEHPLPTETEHPPSRAWRDRRLRSLGLDYDIARSDVAFLNLACYRSKGFDDWSLLSTLPSSRMVQGWAQSVLFPQAERGERVVVCMRSTRWWGLDSGKEGRRYGEALYAPRVTRAGFLRRDALREEIIEAVHRRLGLDAPR